MFGICFKKIQGDEEEGKDKIESATFGKLLRIVNEYTELPYLSVSVHIWNSPLKKFKGESTQGGKYYKNINTDNLF